LPPPPGLIEHGVLQTQMERIQRTPNAFTRIVRRLLCSEEN
jgi:hypothetical protein